MPAIVAVAVASRSTDLDRTVTWRQRTNLWRCDCPGYRHQSKCRHINTVQGWIADGLRKLTITEED